LAVLLVLAGTAAQARPVVVELFTSLACSSCPPADALLTRLAKAPGILALSFNVNYFNSPEFADPYGLTAAVDRQAWYAKIENSQDVYTPEAVVDGTQSMDGGDPGALHDAIAAAQASPAGNVPVSVTGGAMVTISIGAGSGAGEIQLIGYDSQHTTQIGGGENAGAAITESNIVRSITDLGPWPGNNTSITISRPAGQHLAVLLQAPDGAVLGAGSE
jgi:hypothetical protein